MVKVDDTYSKSINQFMCTDFCICPGSPTDTWYKEYQQLPDTTYAKYNRAKTGYDGTIKLDRFEKDVIKPLFWNYDKATGETKADLKSLTSNSFLDCMNKIDDIIDKYKQD